MPLWCSVSSSLPATRSLGSKPFPARVAIADHTLQQVPSCLRSSAPPKYAMQRATSEALSTPGSRLRGFWEDARAHEALRPAWQQAKRTKQAKRGSK